jgi:tetratricopeptide (TPR) repeat protein
MRRIDLIKLAAGLVVLAVLIVLAIKLAGGGGSSPTGGPETWDAATRQHVDQQHALAQDLLDKLQADRARAVLDELLDRFPADHEGHTLMGTVHAVNGSWAQAYQSFRRSLELQPAQPETHLVAGQIAETHLRKPEQARTHYLAARELEPTNAKYTLHLANVSLKLNRLDDARMAALEAAAAEPTVSQAHFIIGEVAARTGKIHMAIESMARARALTEPGDPKFTKYFLRHAELLRRRGVEGRQEALTMLLAAPQPLANSRPVVEQLALTNRSLGRFEQAGETWSAWFRANPYDAEAAAQAGLAYVRADMLDPARRHLERARALKPHHPLVQALEQAIKDEQGDE